jgi:adenylosuccinate lyase
MVLIFENRGLALSNNKKYSVLSLKRRGSIMKIGHPMLEEAVSYLASMIRLRPRRNYFMPGDPNYQPEELKPYLGFDQWASWLIIVEWFWMMALAKIGVIPENDAKLLTKKRLFNLLRLITNTRARELERKKTKHDILALLELMRLYLPKRLHRWLHYCATSYDIINTAYALQLRVVFERACWPKLREVDQLWRKRIRENAEVIQAGRTHLQTALPVTIGFWLAGLHNRFVKSSRQAFVLSRKVPGKFTGAVGTSASQRALFSSRIAEETVMEMLGLPTAEITTQITPPEPTARFYLELDLLSGSVMNFADDVRLLQCSQFGEIKTESSSSSAMAHKTSNPIAAENDAGMHVSVISESMKVLLTLGSNLQRDLRWSNVMRSYCAIMVFLFQQIVTTGRVLKTMRVDKKRCRENFDRESKLVVSELLHLTLQDHGYPESHAFVNKIIMPSAAISDKNLAEETDDYLQKNDDEKLQEIWPRVPEKIKDFLRRPHKFLGDAVMLANREADNRLRKAA